MMSSSCFEIHGSVTVKNNHAEDLSELIRDLMDPVITSDSVVRIYQEVSLTFLAITLLSSNIESQGVVRMYDKQGSCQDKLGSISWSGRQRTWGYVVSQMPFLSSEIQDRMGVEIFGSSKGVKDRVSVFQVSYLVRIGVNSSLSMKGDVFNWPSSSDVPHSVFETSESQENALAMIGSYYSRSGPSSGPRSFWNGLERQKLRGKTIDSYQLALDTFPALVGMLECPYYFLNYYCPHDGREFLSKVEADIKSHFMTEQMWTECHVEEMFKRWIGEWPSEVHPGHIKHHGGPSIMKLRELCSSEKECWRCRSMLRESPEQQEAASGLVKLRREPRTFPSLGDVILSVLKIITAESGLLPGWATAIFGMMH